MADVALQSYAFPSLWIDVDLLLSVCMGVWMCVPPPFSGCFLSTRRSKRYNWTERTPQDGSTSSPLNSSQRWDTHTHTGTHARPIVTPKIVHCQVEYASARCWPITILNPNRPTFPKRKRGVQFADSKSVIYICALKSGSDWRGCGETW